MKLALVTYTECPFHLGHEQFYIIKYSSKYDYRAIHYFLVLQFI